MEIKHKTKMIELQIGKYQQDQAWGNPEYQIAKRFPGGMTAVISVESRTYCCLKENILSS